MWINLFRTSHVNERALAGTLRETLGLNYTPGVKQAVTWQADVDFYRREGLSDIASFELATESALADYL
jgi:hypothetical protein